MFRAGGFPYYFKPNGELMVCLFISNNEDYGGKDPQIAKGAQENDETAEKTACREVAEETGIPEKYLSDCHGVGAYRFRDYDFHIFAFHTKMEIEVSKTEEGRGIWMTSKKALKDIRKEHKKYLQKFCDKALDFSFDID